MHCPQPHISSSSASAATAVSAAFDLKPAKRRGSYNCGRCGMPKKGHVCQVIPASITISTSTPISTPAAATTTETSSSAARPPHPHSARQPYSHLRRALDFDDVDIRCDSPERDLDGHDNPVPDRDPDPDSEIVSGGLPVGCLWDILRRLPPVGLLAAGSVCKGWRETTKRVWRAAEELRLLVPPKAQLRFIGSVLQKCPSLTRLSLKVESDVDATMLACIAFSCPNLESVEISTSDAAVNRITGDELGRFVADKRCLVSLKMEGCSNLGSFVLSSSSLSTLWLSDLYSLSKTVLNCPNLTEISLEFSCQENDTTDLNALVDGMGRSCPRLQNIHIASVRLSHAVVLSLTAANLRGLRMLSLVVGSEITDASVAAIASSYSRLELLDLSGSSITDSGIGMICNVFPNTLSRLLLALCPNITSSGIQFATAQLPLLELMDCGMTICDLNTQDSPSEGSSDNKHANALNSKLHLMYQKLIIKHSRLQKLSLWGCSGLDALCLSCPELNDLNLNSCKNLHPEKLLLQCPSLRNVHASGCKEVLIGSIKAQVSDSLASVENHFPCKRMGDGSKRIQAPNCVSQQSSDDGKKRRRIVGPRSCNVVVD
ncbi:F BOX-LIKE17 [Hibiscus trionum]|uniref:F BOX-LIKE17 n=1 Tax=Hibiscus trionum TaxID=183268 RepID=A0A9W7LJD5_HIBTR|nr:F BOX-LIKE17 [Hibiscus trionum]